MSAAGWRAGAVAVLLAGGLPAWQAHAQGPVSSSTPADVDVTLVGGGGDADALLDTLRELVGRLGLALTPHVVPALTGAPSAPDARVVVVIDFTSPGEIVLNVRSDATHAPGRRRIARDGSASVVREEVADAVSSLVEAQLMSGEAHEAGPASSESAEPPPPPPAPPPAPAPEPTTKEAPQPARPPPRGFAIDLTTFAGVGPLAGNVGLVGRLGGGVVLSSRRGLRPSLAVTGEGLLPFDPSILGVTVHTSVESVRAVVAVEIAHAASWLAVDVGAGFGFDVVSVDPTSYPANALSWASRITIDPVARAAIGANLALTPGVMLTVTALGDVDLVPRHYVVAIGEGSNASQDALLSPWPVRPAAFVGFTFTTFGDGRFASRDPR